MKINVIGGGYVGLVTAALLAQKTGIFVTCVEKNLHRFNKLKAGEVPIREDGLEPLLKGVAFSREIREGHIHVICVGTPSDERGNADLSQVHSVIEDLKPIVNDDDLIVLRSTVPPGTTEQLGLRFPNCSVAFVPEFLREGTAIYDATHQDRVVVGLDEIKSDWPVSRIINLFDNSGNATPLVWVDTRSAELAKLASNFMLASRISAINEVACVARHFGADIEAVARVVGMDSRIGPQFLHSGLGFGGSCFPKDVLSLLRLAEQAQSPRGVLVETLYTNHGMPTYYIDRIKKHFDRGLKGVRVCVWGLTFKPETDDMRESQSIALIKELTATRAIVMSHDPTTNPDESPEDVANQCDAIVVATAWKCYTEMNRSKIGSTVKYLFDLRNCMPKDEWADILVI